MTELANITKNGKLISEDNWKAYISKLENNIKDTDNNKSILKEKLVKAIKKRSQGKFGVAFSGGVDSSFISLILKKGNKEFTCFSVGLENSPDIQHAEMIAEFLKLKLKKTVLNIEQLEKSIPKVMKIVKSRNVVSVGVGLVVYHVLELASQHDVSRIYSGLGSEEIFAGYHRHAEALEKGYKELHEECWQGLKNMWQRDFTRDYTLAKYFNAEFLTPFLDKEVIKTAMNIHPKYKLNKENKKIIFSEIADISGLGQYAWRKKKAAQYGSQVQKALKKISKNNGFNYIKDYLLHV